MAASSLVGGGEGGDRRGGESDEGMALSLIHFAPHHTTVEVLIMHNVGDVKIPCIMSIGVPDKIPF
jgi:hypothetical protein